jgi:ABC-type antimicrobial peptide transport system permease subunit
LYGGIDEEFELDYGSAGRLRFRVVGLLSNSILQGSLVISEVNLLRHFPETGGYRFFLIECPEGQSMQVRQILEDRFSDQGLMTTDTHDLLADLLAVQNTYLSTFQSLGGLGLLLGTFGLVAVQLRSVFERRGELALLRAVGFAPRRIASLVMLEHVFVLLGGLGVGLVAALVAVLPHVATGGAKPPVGTLAGVLSLILVMGLISGSMAVRQIARAPVLDALRGE